MPEDKDFPIDADNFADEVEIEFIDAEEDSVVEETETGVEPSSEGTSGEDPIATESAMTEVEALQTELAHVRDVYLRKLAEFDNFRKRVERERDENRRAGAEEFIAELLPVIDNFDRALQHSEDDSGAFREGVEMIAKQLLDLLDRRDAPRASREQLCRIHSPAFLEDIERQAPLAGLVMLDADTAMGVHSLEAAHRAAGAVIHGVDLLLRGEVDTAFCGIRPPGHHAERERAMGFCIFNNTAVGAAHALAAGLARVAIVDFDVHHGNGTESIFQNDERVMLCSTFQHPFYPHSGYGSTAANVVNSPLPSGADGKAFREAVESHWLPRLEAFEPQLIMVSAGFDAHQADDMANLNLVDADYAWVTRRLCEQADRSGNGHIVSALEGGYELHALARSVEAHLKAFLGDN